MIDKKEVSIVIADDHPLMLKGLSDEFRFHGYTVLGLASDGKEALKLIMQHRPTLAFLDVDMPYLNGFEVVKRAKTYGLDTKFIMFSFHREINYVTQAQNLQINGYFLKEDSFADIEKCMVNILKGKTCFSPSFKEEVLQIATEDLKKLELLTPSEKKILKLVAEQNTSAEIANLLGISERTVEKHRSNMIEKLELGGSLLNWALSKKEIIAGL